ncbi:MAG: multicopper oxidase family protein [Deltaproteobacteria bacterium]|nr:multicopper oxidase family protein [Deltaproteobacteria bacterium]
MVASGCDDGDSPAGDPLALEPLTDTNPDPSIVEVELVAAISTMEYLSGKRADTWGYRDGARAGSTTTTPGPLLDIPLGAHVIVHFRNELPEPTTVHWHGLLVPNTSDGTPVAQMAVPPGGSYEYQFDATDSGLFWYHPHVNADVQIERGLYAPLVVRGGVEPSVSADRIFVLDDVKLESTGKLSTTNEPLDIMLGRQGNVLLVNGRAKAELDVAARTRERWRFVNAANGRFFNLALPGHTFLVIGWDGGPLVTPYVTETLLVAPGERYEVLVEFAGEPGTSVVLQTLHYDRGHNIPDPGPRDLLAVRIGTHGEPPAALPTTWGEFAPLAVDGATPVRRLVLSEEEAGLAEPRFMINGVQHPAPISGVAGDVEIWEIENSAAMDHPFHLHGMFFQVLDVDGVAPSNLGWKDTVNVPLQKTVRFAVRYGEPGRWMFHCHILEHAERGMMGELALQSR